MKNSSCSFVFFFFNSRNKKIIREKLQISKNEILAISKESWHLKSPKPHIRERARNIKIYFFRFKRFAWEAKIFLALDNTITYREEVRWTRANVGSLTARGHMWQRDAARRRIIYSARSWVSGQRGRHTLSLFLSRPPTTNVAASK